MNMEELARLITEKVIAELGSLQKAAKPTERVLVFSESSDAVLKSLRELLGTNVKLVFYDKFLYLDNFARYIIPHLCCPNMAALALGQSTSSMTRAVLNLLLAGKKVEVIDFEYKRYTASAPDALYNLYEGYAKTLQSFGLVSFDHHAGTLLRLRDGLLTEKIVSKAAAQNYSGIVVPEDAIVTALAEESAQNLGLEIKRAGKEG